MPDAPRIFEEWIMVFPSQTVWTLMVQYDVQYILSLMDTRRDFTHGNKLLIRHQYRVCEYEINMVEVIHIELKLAAHSDKVINLESAGVLHKINLGH